MLFQKLRNGIKIHVRQVMLELLISDNLLVGCLYQCCISVECSILRGAFTPARQCEAKSEIICFCFCFCFFPFCKLNADFF